MKKSLLIGVLSTLVFSAASLAAPANMIIANNTGFISNAYVNNQPSPTILGPYAQETVPWAAVTNLCHGVPPAPPLKAADPCAFEVYATSNSANPEEIDVGTIVLSLDDGSTIFIDNKGGNYGLKIVSLAPGQFALTQGSCAKKHA